MSKWKVGFDEWRRKAEALEAENERLRAALHTQWHRAHSNCPDEGRKEDCTSIGCIAARDVLARGEEASSGAPEAIDGDCGLTIEQQAEEARSQAEYTKRREGL